MAVSTLAGIFALIWIFAGVAAFVVEFDKEKAWLRFIIAPFSIFYGIVWVLVALHGRQLRSGETKSGIMALARLDFRHFKKK